MYAVEVKNVNKMFKHKDRDIYALQDVSFNVNKGEIFGFLGPNGAGKTTLINILTTILNQDSGSVKIEGLDVSKNTYKVLEIINTSSGSAICHHLLKVKEILKFYSRLYSTSEKKRIKRVKEIIKSLEIEDLLETKFGVLSSGQKMRTILAKALLNYPKVLLLDEPTIGMDPDIAIKTRKLIRKINEKEKCTILLTSHYMHEVEELCERIAFINHGKIIDIGDIKKLKDKRFFGFKVIIKVKEIINKQFLLKNKFEVKGNTLLKRVQTDDEVSNIMELLSKNGFVVLYIESKSPTLEDYFIKMSNMKK